MTIRWKNYSKFSSEQFKNIIQNKKQTHNFDADFISNISQRRREFVRISMKLLMFNTVLVASLFLNIVADGTSLTVFGLNLIDINDIKEILLFISATLTFFISLTTAHSEQLKEIIKSWIDTNFDSQTKYFAPLPYSSFLDAENIFLGNFQGEGLKWTKVVAVWGAIVFTGTMGILFTIGAASLMIHVAVVVDIYSSPSLSSPWWQLILAYVITVDLTVFALMFVYSFPLPFREVKHTK